MTIRERLTLTYSTATAIVVIALGIFIFIFTSRYHDREFYSRLDERVEITEQLFLEEENLEPEIYKSIREKFLHTLDNEIELVEKIEGNPKVLKGSLKERFPAVFIDNLFLKEIAHFKHGNKMGAGKLFSVKDGNYVIIVQAEDLFGNTKLQHLGQILAIGIPICILIIVLIGRYTAKRALEPVLQKIDQVNEITATKLHKRLNVINEDDEIGSLALTFNKLLERLETAFKLQKKFIANASHEIRNPLAAILGEAEVSLSKERDAVDYKLSLERISLEANRLNSLVSNLLQLAKAESDSSQMTLQELRLDEIMFEVLQSINFSYPENRVNIELPANVEDSSELEIMANPNLIKAALLNLLENAVKFSENDFVLFQLKNEVDSLVISVIDKGIGIPDEELDKINQTFYRASNAMLYKGFGIGVPLAMKIFEIHNATFILKKNNPVGTIAEVRFFRK
jgi:signal transduction histidine kinase